MDKSQFWFIENGKKFSMADAELIRQRLKDANDDAFMQLTFVDIKDPTMMFIVSLFAGTLGIDRFLIGQTGMGVAKLLTCGGCFIWYIIDLFQIMDLTKKTNFEKVRPYLP